MYFKINLQILIVIFLILLIFLILFKNNLRSEFLKQSHYLNNENFSNVIYVNSSGNTLSITSANNIGTLWINYYRNFTNKLSPLLRDATITTIYPRYWKLPLIYMFDPSGFPNPAQKTASYYNTSTSTSYSLFNNVAESVLLNTPTRGVTIGNYQTPLSTFPTTYTNMPKNLFNLKMFLGGSDTDTSTTTTGLTVLRQAPVSVTNVYTSLIFSNAVGPGTLTTDTTFPGLFTISDGLTPPTTYYEENITNFQVAIDGSTLGPISTPLMRNRTYILGVADILNVVNNGNTYIKYLYTTFKYFEITITTSPAFNTAKGIT